MCVLTVDKPVKSASKLKLNAKADASTLIWFVVPVAVNVSLAKVTLPVPVLPAVLILVAPPVASAAQA